MFTPPNPPKKKRNLLGKNTFFFIDFLEFLHFCSYQVHAVLQELSGINDIHPTLHSMEQKFNCDETERFDRTCMFEVGKQLN